ncbi:hypothetical protein JMJ77_0000046 [Colletotrichum scovillei]|uniref:Uncharacterized protein n=1 Tax=Colletotrichum scovillei TaxID=1209932 RepID=A0A9P7RBG3_9PEZI|nr:hypothetical protein JMJ77_0000046 [Colletotrichum scovillei]KAG7071243.1 hypothetical protein JMJ76_0004118 [Colletotrichum scovillei]KAG7079469.1 hypothetical protein JMJ78_0006578 [Colletotrichum scovillei]
MSAANYISNSRFTAQIHPRTSSTQTAASRIPEGTVRDLSNPFPTNVLSDRGRDVGKLKMRFDPGPESEEETH